LKDLPAGRYYWSVQAIDTGLLAGEWSCDESFVIKAGTPSITLQKKVDRTRVELGGTITYTITYANTGSATATDVTIVEVLPEHTALKGVGDQVLI